MLFYPIGIDKSTAGHSCCTIHKCGTKPNFLFSMVGDNSENEFNVSLAQSYLFCACIQYKRSDSSMCEWTSVRDPDKPFRFSKVIQLTLETSTLIDRKSAQIWSVNSRIFLLTKNQPRSIPSLNDQFLMQKLPYVQQRKMAMKILQQKLLK